MRLIIVGSGRCVWDDLALIGFPRQPKEDVMAVNDMIMHFPYPIQHAYSIDNSRLNEWLAARRPWYSRADGVVRKHCIFKCPGAEKQDLKVHANSGINAVYCALDLGYTEITVCGVPVDNTGHYFDPPWVETNYERLGTESTKYILGDHIKYCDFDERVYFISGRASGKKPSWFKW